MNSPGVTHNRNQSMEYEGATGASGKKQVVKKNLSKFIKPYNRTDKPQSGSGAIVVGRPGGPVKIEHLINTNPDETDTDNELRKIQSSMVKNSYDANFTPSENMTKKKRVIQTAQSR